MRTALRLTAFVFALLAAWLLVLRPAQQPVATTVPGTNVPDGRLLLDQADSSLDLEVVGRFDHPAVFAVELRRAPDHRIVSIDPATGEAVTVRLLSDVEQAYGLALHPSAQELAVAWTPDVSLRGNGLHVLALATGEFREVVPTTTGVFLTDPLWVDERRVLLTRTDVRGGVPTFDLVEVDVVAGTLAPRVTSAVTAAVTGGRTHFLVPDAQSNGRAVHALADDGATAAVVTADGEATIDHLLAGPDAQLWFAVHLVEDGGIVVGAPALAHQGPSTWFVVEDPQAPDPRPLGPGAASVLDAATTRSGVLVQVDREGLAFVEDGRRVRVIGSRSLVFVTG